LLLPKLLAERVWFLPLRRYPRIVAPLLLGEASVTAGLLSARLILTAAELHQRSGNGQMANDALLMLWAPGVLAFAGLVWIVRGLLRSVLQLLRLLLGRRAPPQTAAAFASSPGRAVSRKTASGGAASGKAVSGRAVSGKAASHNVVPGNVPWVRVEPYLRACAALGVAPGSSWAEIRAEWRRQVPSWHPDRGGDLDLWHQRLEAYRVLEAWRHLVR
jgi:hypothetical protein